MSAEHRYGDALQELNGTESVGMKGAVEAIADGNREIAAEMLHTVADMMEDNADE